MPRDQRFVSTVEAYERLLVEDGLMLRYRNPDDLGETTSAFTICSFWWGEALALMGRLDDAIAVFQPSADARQSASGSSPRTSIRGRDCSSGTFRRRTRTWD